MRQRQLDGADDPHEARHVAEIGDEATQTGDLLGKLAPLGLQLRDDGAPVGRQPLGHAGGDQPPFGSRPGILSGGSSAPSMPGICRRASANAARVRSSGSMMWAVASAASVLPGEATASGAVAPAVASPSGLEADLRSTP